MRRTKRFYEAYWRIWERYELKNGVKLSAEDLVYLKYDFEKKAEAVCKLARLNSKLQRLNELWANPPEIPNGRFKDWEEFESFINKEYEKTEKKVYEIARENGFYVRIQHDPRGSAIKLSLFEPKSIEFAGTDTDLIV